jgi:AraC family transcriptional regulator
MLPVRRIEAELTLPDAGVHILSSHWPTTLEYTFTSPRHLFAMYLSTVSEVEGRYFEDDDQAGFSPVGPLFFRPAKLHLNIRGTGGREARAVHCTLEDRRLQALNAAGIDWSHGRLQAALNIRAAPLRSHFLRLIHEVRRPSFASPAVADAVLVLMVSDLFAYLSPALAAREAPSSGPDGMVGKVRERVYDLQAVTPTVGELAMLCGVSERHLLRLFRQRRGVSLIEFIRQARLEKAVELLSTSDLPLKEIAFRLGFGGHASFSTAFGRETGVSPAAFRRDRRRAYPAAAPGGFG